MVIVYCKGRVLAKFYEARHGLLQVVKKTLENIPNSQAALFQHVNRALLQCGFYWNQVTFVHQEIPDFREWVGKGRQ